MKLNVLGKPDFRGQFCFNLAWFLSISNYNQTTIK